jgi:hypothetical protein
MTSGGGPAVSRRSVRDVVFTDGPVEGLDRYVLTSPPFFA